MKAAILAIGDELVLGEKVDTNSAWLSTQLALRGVLVVEHRTLGDHRQPLATTIAQLAKSVEVLILTGGLGPTQDDLTREALGDAMDPGQDLIVDERALRELLAIFRRSGRDMPESNHSQSKRPVWPRILPNPHGTAPGLSGELDQCLVFALPGPPREMMPMFRDHVARHLEGRGNESVLVTKTVHSFGIGEALAAERLGDLLERDKEPVVGITASESIVTARVRSRGNFDVATPEADAIARRIESAWEPYAFGRDEDTLAIVVGRLLYEQGLTLTTAESCTGGWLGKLLVDVPGSSAYYRGGWVTYTNQMKMKSLGVPASIFEMDGPGAVSDSCAKAMARGALQLSNAQVSLAITGVAGPEGGTPEKPVGTVFIALGRKIGDRVEATVRRFEFKGNRTTIRLRSAQSALQILRLALLEKTEAEPMLWERTTTLESIQG